MGRLNEFGSLEVLGDRGGVKIFLFCYVLLFQNPLNIQESNYFTVTIGGMEFCVDYKNLGHNFLQKSLLILESNVGLPGHLIYNRAHSMCRMKVILEEASLESRGSDVL